LIAPPAEWKTGVAVDSLRETGGKAMWLARRGWRVDRGRTFPRFAMQKARCASAELGLETVNTGRAGGSAGGMGPDAAGVDLADRISANRPRPELSV